MIASYESKVLEAKQEFEQMAAYVAQAIAESESTHVVEERVWQHLLRIGHRMVEGFVRAQGDGDVGPTLTLKNGQTVKRLHRPHSRQYVSIFGPIPVSRYVYGTRETQKIEAIPLDARLDLPEGDFSYLLQKWDQSFCVRDSFLASCESVQTILGLPQSVRALQHMNQSMASDVESFRLSQPLPEPDREGPLMVVAADGKGVPMCRDAPQDPDQPRASKRRTKGQKADSKRMACVGAAYTIDAFVRTPDHLIDELLHGQSEPRRPRPQSKRVRADLTVEWDDVVVNGKDTLFAWLADEVEYRAVPIGKPVICLMDGDRALLRTAKRYLPQHTIYVLDLFHVLEKLWQAAHCFHAEGSDEAEQFVEHRLRMLLEGQVS